jgi:hypothetical protein
MTANLTLRMPVLVLGSVALLAMGVLAPSTQAHKADKVKVCHRPPGNPSNFRILSVAPSAVAEHIAHGDNLVEPEVCDNVDNDCDGVVDNRLDTLGTCTVGKGECAMTAPVQCIQGVQVCTAVAGTPVEPVEVFCADGKDNDCNGLVDRADPACQEACEADCAALRACQDRCLDKYWACGRDCGTGPDCNWQCQLEFDWCMGGECDPARYWQCVGACR